jgi:beta-lactamase regulating signal transducer with metallopeptidase domain/protocatechuate 3,4-dioxygenase beta subunit
MSLGEFALLPLLFRATILLSLSALVVELLARVLRPLPANVERVAWFLVLVQGVILIPLPLEVAWYDPEPNAVADAVPEPRALLSDESSATVEVAQAPLLSDPREMQPASVAGPSGAVRVSASLLLAWGTFGVWITGIACILLLALSRYVGFLKNAANLAVPPRDWQEQWEQLLISHGIRRRILLQVSDGLGPAICLLPSGYSLIVPHDVWMRFTPAQRLAVLRHEVAHYERGDLWKSLGVRFLAAVHWFNPLAWHAARKFGECTEWACDDLAAGNAAADAHEYAQTLLALGRGLGGASPGRAAHGGRLYHRIRRLAAGRPVKESAMKTVALFVSVLMLLVAGAVRVELVAKEPPPTPSISAAKDESSQRSAEERPAAKVEDASQQTAPEEPPPALLSAAGRVIDPSGQPVVGAAVYLREWSTYRISQEPYNQDLNDILAETQTDASGAFRFENVPAKPLHEQWLRQIPWDVVVVAKSYAIAWRHLDAAQQPAPLTIALRPEARISGRVTDQQGQPIEGAKVRVNSINSLASGWGQISDSPESFDLQLSRLAPAAKTDADGKVTVLGLPSNVRLSVVVDHDDYRRGFLYIATTEEAQPEIDLPSSFEGLARLPVHLSDFSLALSPPLLRVRGRVIAADTKKPLGQIRVDLLRGLGTMTDSDGRFTFKDIRELPCRLLVFAPTEGEYLGRFVNIDAPPQGFDREIAIELERGQSLSGRVVDEESGMGVRGVSVLFDNGLDVNRATTDAPLPSYESTDADGRFRVTVPPGKAKVRIYGRVPGYDLPYRSYPPVDVEGFYKDVEVIAGEPAEELRFTVRRLAAGDEPRGNDTAALPTATRIIEGTVVDAEGKPVAGAEVGHRRWFNGDREGHPFKTGPDGRFTLRLRSVPTEWIVAVYKERKLRGHVPDNFSTGTGNNPVEIRLVPTGTIKGRVAEADRPIAGIYVYLNQYEAADEQGSLKAVDGHVTKTGSDGRFEFPLVEADTLFHLSIWAEGYVEPEPRSERVRVAAGDTFEVKPFSLVRADKSIAGMVVDPDGNPVSGVSVSASLRSGGQIPRAFTERGTGKDGRFTIRGVPDLPLTLMAYIRPPDDATDRRIQFPAHVDAEAGETDVRILLDPKLVRRKN